MKTCHALSEAHLAAVDIDRMGCYAASTKAMLGWQVGSTENCVVVSGTLSLSDTCKAGI